MKFFLRLTFIKMLSISLLITGCREFPNATKNTLSKTQRDSIMAKAENLRVRGKALREDSRFAEAMDFQQKALELSLDAEDTLNIVYDYNQLATTLRRLGRLEEAMHQHYSALQYAEEYSDSAAMFKSLTAAVNGLGNVFYSLGDLDEAEKYFRRSLSGEKVLKSDVGLAINYANLGSVFLDRNQIDSARVYFEMSMKRNVEINNLRGQSLCHVHFGDLLSKEKKYEEAMEEYRKAANMMRGIGDVWHTILPLLSLGNLLVENGSSVEANAVSDRCLELSEMTKSFELMKDTYTLKARLKEKDGDAVHALEYYKLANAMRDSIMNRKENEDIRDVCINYEHEKSERKIEVMRLVYESKQELHMMFIWLGGILVFVMLVVIFAVSYALKARSKGLEALRSVDSMRTTFLTNITHEFRTPLTVMIGLADQLKTPDLDEKMRYHYLDSIKKQGDKLLDLVNELLSISKLMAGHGQVEWRRGDIISCIKMAVVGYADYAKVKHIDLKTVSSEDRIEMDFVPEYIDRIIRNLLSNSFKFTPALGSITLTMERHETNLILEISDTGSGIPDVDLPHVFELFYQGGSQRKQGSTGIGLPFVRQMVEFMGGTVDAYNREPGTTMRIVLPLQQTSLENEPKPWTVGDNYTVSGSVIDAAALNMENEAAAAKTQPEPSGSDLPLVMIVEDNDDVADYITLLLHLHYRVVRACDGYEALHKLEKELPDLILTDLMMPGMDGYELCSVIRQSEMLGGVPIVIVSARSSDEDRVRGFEVGADGYLTKPFNADELQAIVSRLISQTQKRRKELQMSLATSTLTYTVGNGVPTNAEEGAPVDGTPFPTTEEEKNVRVVSEEDAKFMENLQEVVDKQMLKGQLVLDTIAPMLCASKSTLNRRIKAITGYSASVYILQLRLQKACRLLSETNTPIGEVSLACGFDDMSYFSRVFRQNFEVTPSVYRQQHSQKK